MKIISNEHLKAVKSLSCSQHREKEQTSMSKAQDLRLELLLEANQRRLGELPRTLLCREHKAVKSLKAHEE